jgi:hypothetical protein
MTLREKATQNIVASAPEYAAYEHERNYRKLHVRRDGSVAWSEFIDRHSDLIDEQAQGFAAVPSVATVGTGSCMCNCDYCISVYDAAEEATAIEDGREYKREEKWESRAEAVREAVAASDLAGIEEMMLARLDEIPQGYFNDEDALRAEVGA